MIPTFFAVSLIVFVIINMAPGSPGELAAAQGQESADESGSKREAYRIFKEQFNPRQTSVVELSLWACSGRNLWLPGPNCLCSRSQQQGNHCRPG